MEASKQIELDLADAIIDRPKGFSVGHRHFYLYPITLGKMYLQKRVVENLDINQDFLKANPYAEVLRLVETKKEDCCLLLAYHTLQTKKDVLSNRIVTIRKNIFAKEMNNEDIATLVLACLTSDKTTTFIHYLGDGEELKRMDEVAKAKSNSNSFNFCGVSIYGTLIDAACEKYKWTYDYVLWEISYTNLQLMLKDSVKSIYLSDDEQKRVHIIDPRNSIDGNNITEVMNAIAEGNWK